MNVWYVTMQFPAASETFAGVEVRALRNAGAELAVHTLRFPVSGWEKLLVDWGLSDIDVNAASWSKVLRGILTCVVTPIQTSCLLFWVLRKTWYSPKDLCKSVLLIPLIMALFVRVREDRPDVVHLFWGHYPTMLGFLLRRYCPDVVLSVFLGAYDLRLKYGGSPEVAINADIVWTHTRYNVGEIESFGVLKDNIKVSYRGIDLTLSPNMIRTKIPHRIVSAGRLNKWKRMDWVLRTFRDIHAQWPSASLVILGEGPEEEALKQLAQKLGIQSSVDFKGYIAHDKVYSEMLKAEVFLFLSRDERLPNVVKEAMACRCICVVTKTPGIEELVNDGKNGFVLAPDMKLVTSLLERIFRHEIPVDSIAADARATVHSLFNVDRNVGNYLKVWQELIDSKKCH